MHRDTIRDVQCYLWLQEKIHWKISVQQFWCFMHKILQVQRKRMLYLSLAIDSVGHYLRYANIKVSSERDFPIYGQNPRAITGKYISEKTRIFAYFTQ